LIKPFDLDEAITFLRAPLEWSDDFDSIRDSLANLLQQVQSCNTEEIKKLEPALSHLVGDLLDDISPK